MAKKFGLGKGLGALIPNEEETEQEKQSTLKIDINKIKCDVNQPRKSFDSDKIVELSESIKSHGIIQPLILRKNDDDNTYTIIAGERRWRAAKMAKLKEVPSIIMDLDDKDILEISLIENIQRQDLNPIEEAEAYKRLLGEFKITQEELSKRVGKSRTAITNTMRLINLDVRVRQYLIDGIISEGHGRCLLSVANLNKQYELAQKVIDEKLSVRELEKLIKFYKNDNTKKTKEKKDVELNAYYKEIRSELQNHFGTKVNLSNKNNKGKIEIEYYSADDLQRILDILNI